MSTFEKDLNANRADLGSPPIDADGDGTVETWGATDEDTQAAVREGYYTADDDDESSGTSTTATSTTSTTPDSPYSVENDPRQDVRNWDGDSSNAVDEDREETYTFDETAPGFGAFGNGYVPGNGTHENYNGEDGYWYGTDPENQPAANAPVSADWIEANTHAPGEGTGQSNGGLDARTVAIGAAALGIAALVGGSK
ncbi:hypothetical protein [Halomarina oriensis]|uniref:Uncharacterized protein n=1 Tax=Halomarina oriensis TaxID=671145 RepID=A0A6B0GG21_9EURY|nr:hypothetical protein [Halomarina oriensis]MWG32977.1 hypothetical protein [Halomarina oriensis]